MWKLLIAIALLMAVPAPASADVTGKARVIDGDTIVLCAGQLPNRTLYDGLTAKGINVHLIGGVDVAAELDAQRAIDQATRLAVSL